MAVILHYFSEFGYLPGVLRKSSCSLSHLLMSSCFTNNRSAVLSSQLPMAKEDPDIVHDNVYYHFVTSLSLVIYSSVFVSVNSENKLWTVI